MRQARPSSLTRNHVRVVGTGAKALLLAHGFGTDQTAWRHIEAALLPANTYRLVLFDHMGAGQSDLKAYSPHRYRSLHSYANDLLEILDALEIDRVYYVGHSMGCIIGLLAALSDPARFARMIFVGASPRYLNDSDGYQGGFEQRDIDAIYAAMTTHYQAWASGFAGLAMGNRERPELAAEFAATLSATRPDIALGMARVIFQSDHRADVPLLTVPTLIVQAQQDIAVPRAVGEYLAARLPRGEFCMIDAQGHLPHISAPDQVLAALHSFLP